LEVQRLEAELAALTGKKETLDESKSEKSGRKAELLRQLEAAKEKLQVVEQELSELDADQAEIERLRKESAT